MQHGYDGEWQTSILASNSRTVAVRKDPALDAMWLNETAEADAAASGRVQLEGPEDTVWMLFVIRKRCTGDEPMAPMKYLLAGSN